jgi:hypothetical protein
LMPPSIVLLVDCLIISSKSFGHRGGKVPSSNYNFPIIVPIAYLSFPGILANTLLWARVRTSIGFCQLC